MKKKSVIVNEKNAYEVLCLINNTAYVMGIDAKKGLFNIKTNQIITNMDRYDSFWDKKSKIYCLIKELHELSCFPKKIIKIYDALNEKMIADGFEIIKVYDNFDYNDHYYVDKYSILVTKSPIDGKLHLFDRYACRNITNIFDTPLDDVNEILSQHKCIYLVVTANGKKGLYQHEFYNSESSLILPIEFDDIQKFSNIIVFTQNNQKYFVYTSDINKKDISKKSSIFDDIETDKKKGNIIYCKKGKQIYVYNTQTQELLLSIDAEKIKYMYKKGINGRELKSGYIIELMENGVLYFEIMKNGKKGVICLEIKDDYRKMGIGPKVFTLLAPEYDKIESRPAGLYLKKDEKYGLFIGNLYNNQIIEPKYDIIDFLQYGYEDCIALYNNGLCDIVEKNIYGPCNPIITDCEIAECFDYALSYKKDGKYGLIFIYNYRHKNIFPPIYDKISNIEKYTYIFEKNNKKGLMHLGKIVISIKYDEIIVSDEFKIAKSCGGELCRVLYIALKKRNKYALAKLYPDIYEGTNVEFISDYIYNKIDLFHDIIVLKNRNHTYIFDYNGNLLKTLPANASITAHEKQYSELKQHDSYCIDGECYFYYNGKLEEVYTENKDLYLTTYETDQDLFEIRCYNKNEHDLFCSTIDSQKGIEAEKSLIEMSEKGLPRNEYPTLILKRKRRNN